MSHNHPAETPLKRFRPGELAYLRVRVVGPAINIDGTPAAAVVPLDSIGRASMATHYVKENGLVSQADVKSGEAMKIQNKIDEHEVVVSLRWIPGTKGAAIRIEIPDETGGLPYLLGPFNSEDEARANRSVILQMLRGWGMLR